LGDVCENQNELCFTKKCIENKCASKLGKKINKNMVLKSELLKLEDKSLGSETNEVPNKKVNDMNKLTLKNDKFSIMPDEIRTKKRGKIGFKKGGFKKGGVKRSVKQFLLHELHDPNAIKISESDCKSYENITLKKHQHQIVEKMISSKRRGVLLYHGLGSGKTVTGIAIARCLLSYTNANSVIVLTPTSVVEQFKNEIQNIGMSSDTVNAFRVYSYQRWLDRYESGYVSSKDTIMIIDEIHNFNAPITKSKGHYNRLMIQATKEAVRVILLSGTPVANTPKELVNYMAILQNQSVEEAKLSYKNLKIPAKVGDLNKLDNEELNDKFNAYTNCHFSYFENIQDLSNYPRVNEINVLNYMSKEYYKEYELIEQSSPLKSRYLFNEESQLKPFYNGIRRAVNNLHIPSPKMEWIENNIKKITDLGKGLIYSTWKKFGIHIIQDILKKQNISYDTIEGSISARRRASIVQRFNNNQFQILVITKSGSEGLDLKEVRSVIITEPYWNSGRIEQVIGRAVRYRSHAALDEKDRTVDIYNLIAVKPRSNTDTKETADEIMLKLSNTKSEFIHKLKKIIMKNGIENDSTGQCDNHDALNS
jgi:superfamily II DNA or RNA helicase